jgi:hypothetical protein
LLGFESKYIEMYALNFSKLLYTYTIKLESNGAPKKSNRVVIMAAQITKITDCRHVIFFEEIANTLSHCKAGQLVLYISKYHDKQAQKFCE